MYQSLMVANSHVREIKMDKFEINVVMRENRKNR